MTISYEQFRAVLPDDAVRRELGLMIDDAMASHLLANEPQAILYYEQWSRGGQRRTDMPADDAHRFNRAAVSGFVAAMLALVVWWLPIASVISLIGGIASLMGLSQIRKYGGRGRGLALAGVWCSSAVFALAVLGIAQRMVGLTPLFLP